MRNQCIAAIAAMALLGGCNSTDQGTAQNGAKTQEAKPEIASGTSINGTVTIRDNIPINPGAKLDVKLVNIAQPEIAIAEKTVDVSGPPPYTFTLDFDRSKISATPTYVINAVLTDGPRRFLPALNSPVLTHGSSTTTEVILNAEATPAEKLAEECTRIEKQIGGMHKVSGTSLLPDSSVGWDAFAQGGKVRYVRVNTDFDKGGHSSVNYAYDNRQPLCVKQPGGVKSKWIVGWNDAGEAVFGNKPDGSELDDAAIASLKDDATKAFQMAQDKLDASKKKK